HRIRIAPEHERVAVAAIRGERCVAVTEVRERADDGGFRAIGKMRVAPDHAGVLGEGALHAGFEFSDAQHLGVDPDLPLGIGCLDAHVDPLWVFARLFARYCSRAAAITRCVLVNASVAAVSSGHLRMYSFSTSTPIGPS